MYDDVEVVEHDPGGLECTVDGFGAEMLVLAEFVGDFIDDGAKVRFASAGGDDEIIGHGRQFTHVEDNDVFRLFVVCQFAAEQREFS